MWMVVEELVAHVILAEVVLRTCVHVHHPEGVHCVQACLRTKSGQVPVRDRVVWDPNLCKIT